MQRHFILALIVWMGPWAMGQKKSNTPPPAPDSFTSADFGALKLRPIGPAVTSGRVADFAVNPRNPSEYYVATASGGVWKTENRGVTYYPVFDRQGSYSIGCVTLDPQNPAIVWVGTGENHNQRSVGYGDGVYKSEDGGRTWKHMGLPQSEHIANIIVHPDSSHVVYVAAYGPLWNEGGDRGVYKSRNGGKTWELIKSVSAYTGCNNLVMDPFQPHVLYAAFHQRMRKVFTYIGGGPESGLFKSTDGGQTWQPMQAGLPSGHKGRIGIDASRVKQGLLYAVVEAKEGGGVYRSTNAGASWEKRSGYFSSGNYYQELTCDPQNADRFFITDTYYKVSHDGGKTMVNLGEINKHIDNHAIWINPANTNHLLVGCDGGIYETWDFAATWHFKENLPVTQFYKVATDNAYPFYHVHGGTQDNLSLGGPSRSTSINGIVNADWYITSLGDGFETQVDPNNPDIIYAQRQYGGLVRFDRKSGEYLPIQPIEPEGQPAYRWNWDAPLVASRYKSGRLYFGANKVFRSDDHGDSWKTISPDLSRQVDRNRLEVMGQVWSMDAMAKNQSTDIYGQLTSIAESGIDEKILWAGTDDGLIHLTTNGGETWTSFDNLPGVPERSYVHQIIASLHDKNTAYVCFNHHRYGNFKPYVLRTKDGGKTWVAIQNNLPERGSVYSIAEDHIDPELLFVGTEFGLFVSQNGGQQWTQLQSGLPTVAVRDLEIQRRENDLVLATFGRGFYVLDNYAVLRNHKPGKTDKAAAVIYPVKESLVFLPRYPLGLRDKGHLGSSYFSAPNPAVGAVFDYYVKESISTLKEQRQEREKAALDKKQPAYYPPADSIRLEDQQPDPYLLFTIKKSNGEIVRHLKAPNAKGLQRIVWDFRHNNPAPVANRYVPAPDVLFGAPETGPLATPGQYTISLARYADGQLTELAGPVGFSTKLLQQSSLPVNLQANEAFYEKTSRLRKATSAAAAMLADMETRVSEMEKAALDMPASPAEWLSKTYAIKQRIAQMEIQLYGDVSLARREFETPPSIMARVGGIQDAVFNSTAMVPGLFKESYDIAARQFGKLLTDMRQLASELAAIEKQLNLKGAPYTQGRWPDWD